MLDIVVLMIPIFLLISVGFMADRLELMPEGGASALNLFMFNLGLPALIFEAIAGCNPSDLKQFDFLFVFSVGLLASMFLTLAIMRRCGRSFSESCVLAMMAASPNVTFVGLPMLMAFFPGNRTVVLASSISNILLIFMVLLAMLMLDMHKGADTDDVKKRSGLAAAALLFLVKNPVLIATLAGLLFCGFGLSVPGPLEVFCHMLGSTVAPCALVALGFMVSLQLKERGSYPKVSTQLIINGVKFIVQPLLVWGLFTLLGTDPFWTALGVLLAATPSATLAYILSEKYNVAGAESSWAIISSILLSLLVLPLLALVFR